MTEGDVKFHADNCIIVTDPADPLFGKCRRKRWSADVDKDWLAAANKRRERFRIAEERSIRKKEKETEAEAERDTEPEVTEEEEPEDETSDDEIRFERKSNFSEEPLTFPEIPARYSTKELNLDLIEVIAHLECTFEVPANRSRQVVAYVLNTLCGQNLVIPSEEEEKREDDEEKEENNEEREEDDTEKEEVPKKKRRKFEFKKNILCSRKTMRKYIQDAGMLNLFHAAETIKNSQEEGDVVTVGWDDTTKKGGNRVWDIKTGHVTIVDSEKNRSTLSLGFTQNISHKGKDSAQSVMATISKIAKATDSTAEEALSFFDFHMTDRAGDSDTMLDDLGILEESRLKCNAHPTLAVGQAIDKVFRDFESNIGVEKLISTGASHCFSSATNSIWYLGLLAVAKALSPSHCTESISLYTLYTKFLKGDASSTSDTAQISVRLIKSGFKGFSSNRFGRIGELSSLMKDHTKTVIRFFNECVDENSNKLSLAISAYVSSEWFRTCVDVAAEFDKMILVPMKEALGIDLFKMKPSKYRSWDGMKTFFDEKMLLLKHTSEEAATEPIKRLKSDVARSIHIALRRQLDCMPFYREGGFVSEDVRRKMNFCPMTNGGCESNFGDVTQTLKKVGGSTSIEKLSDMHLEKKNGLFLTDDWRMLSQKEKKEKWKEARNSARSKAIRKIGEDFLKKVEGMKDLANFEKRRKKQNKNARALKLLKSCKSHGGPVAIDQLSSDILEKLEVDQLLLEVRYLRATVAPNIREKRMLENGKFQTFSKAELLSQIKNALNPENDLISDVSTLLQGAYQIRDADTSAVVELPSEDSAMTAGMVGWWTNSLGVQQVGVVLDNESIQMYTCKRFGYSPFGLPASLDSWDLVEEIEDFYYIQNNHGIYMQLRS